MIWNDTRAQSIQIGAVLLFGIIIILLASWQAFGIPNQNEGIEFNHNQELQQQLTELRTTANSMVEASATRSVTVNLGVRYPSRTLFVNPPPAAGTLRTAGTTDSAVNITLTNITTRGEAGDFWNGSTRSFNTGALEYEPRYNVYGSAPTTVYGQTVLYNEFTSGRTLSLTEQAFLDGDQLSLITLNGSLTANRIDAASIDIAPIHTQTQTVETVDTGENITLTLPSQLAASQWRQLLADEPRFLNATAVADGVKITLAPGEYDLQLTKLGVGQRTARNNATYITNQNGQSFTITNTESQLITVETRNKYNDRVNATVTAQLTQGAGEIRREQATGVEYTYRYTPPDDTAGETAKIRFTLAKNETPPDVAIAPDARNVTATVNVTAPANGTATQPEYRIKWDENASSTRFIAGGDSDNLVYFIQDKPQLTGSANFAIENQSIGQLPGGYTQTFTDGGGSVMFTSNQSGSTRVIASSGTSQDTLNVTVFPEPDDIDVTANITKLSLDNEYVTFTYTGEPVSTEGWILHDDGRNFEFIFPRQILTSGETVVVTTEQTPESAVPDTDYRFNWSINTGVWNNGGDIAFLRDAGDREIDQLANGTAPGPTTYTINSIDAVASGGNSIDVTVNYTTDDPNANVLVRAERDDGQVFGETDFDVPGEGTRERTITIGGANQADRIVVIIRDQNGDERTRREELFP